MYDRNNGLLVDGWQGARGLLHSGGAQMALPTQATGDVQGAYSLQEALALRDRGHLPYTPAWGGLSGTVKSPLVNVHPYTTVGLHYSDVQWTTDGRMILNPNVNANLQIQVIDFSGDTPGVKIDIPTPTAISGTPGGLFLEANGDVLTVTHSHSLAKKQFVWWRLNADNSLTELRRASFDWTGYTPANFNAAIDARVLDWTMMRPRKVAENLYIVMQGYNGVGCFHLFEYDGATGMMRYRDGRQFYPNGTAYNWAAAYLLDVMQVAPQAFLFRMYQLNWDNSGNQARNWGVFSVNSTTKKLAAFSYPYGWANGTNSANYMDQRFHRIDARTFAVITNRVRSDNVQDTYVQIGKFTADYSGWDWSMDDPNSMQSAASRFLTMHRNGEGSSDRARHTDLTVISSTAFALAYFKADVQNVGTNLKSTRLCVRPVWLNAAGTGWVWGQEYSLPVRWWRTSYDGNNNFTNALYVGETDSDGVAPIIAIYYAYAGLGAAGYKCDYTTVRFRQNADNSVEVTTPNSEPVELFTGVNNASPDVYQVGDQIKRLPDGSAVFFFGVGGPGYAIKLRKG